MYRKNTADLRLFVLFYKRPYLHIKQTSFIGDPLAQRERGGSLFLERRTKELLISLISLSPIFPFPSLLLPWQGSPLAIS